MQVIDEADFGSDEMIVRDTGGGGLAAVSQDPSAEAWAAAVRSLQHPTTSLSTAVTTGVVTGELAVSSGYDEASSSSSRF